MWWQMPISSALERQRQKDHKFEASLGYAARLRLKSKQNKMKETGMNASWPFTIHTSGRRSAGYFFWICLSQSELPLLTPETQKPVRLACAVPLTR
jgi:hypothetical protein